jgi:hypothetical protein
VTATADCGGFTVAHYREIIERALDLGYEFSTISEHESVQSPRLILMRHDIDLSLENCLRFARIEHELGVRATYFVRVHGRLYNPFEFHSYRSLQEIESLGHELGLHYEPGFAVAVGEDPAAMVRREKAILEAILDHPIASASAHLPGKTGATVNDSNKESFGIAYEAYSPRLVKDFKYLSDSNGRWREGCLCQHLGSFDRLCVLTHGWWWFEKSPVENY